MNIGFKKKIKELSGSLAGRFVSAPGGKEKRHFKLFGKFRKKRDMQKEEEVETDRKLLSYFEDGKDRFKKEYNESKFLRKIKKAAKTTGSNLIYVAMVLYYSLLGNNVSFKDKAMIIAALGYFITPADFIPDIFGLIGFGDDLAVLLFVFKRLRDNVTPEVRHKAKAKIMELFGEQGLSDLKMG